MNIAILCGPDSWYFRDLSRAAQTRGHQVQAVAFSEVRAEVGAKTRGDEEFLEGRAGMATSLDAFDAVLVRTMPPGSLEQVVFRMDVLGQWQAQGGLVLNSPRAIEIAVDKFLTTSLLARAGIPTPPTIVCQTVEQAMPAFDDLGGDVVLKPLFGGEGRGITRISDEALMLRAAKMLAELGAVMYVQTYVPHRGCDRRILLIGDKAFAMQRCNPNDWRTNVSRGAVAQPWSPDARQVELARAAAGAVQAEIAGVDLLPDESGNLWVLEVNAVPGWKALARVTQQDIATEVVAHLERCWAQR